ncbi:CDP-glycerol glycerophosphotransferase family protein, partial [Staphylococcus saprophyticus]|uniref:CDP-glycerol glycerophosphotransferase family protein n=1 Tax=Staphylococcus saprophyticus TaxID=29385 RepID=UPI0037048312
MPFYPHPFPIKQQNIIPTPLPTTHILFHQHYQKPILPHIQQPLPILKPNQLILFPPTFTPSRHHTPHYPFFKIHFPTFPPYSHHNNPILLFNIHPFLKDKFNFPTQYQQYFLHLS